MRRKKTERGFRSKAEERFADFLEAKGVKFEYEKYKLEYIVPVQSKKYLPDFYARGIFLEFKGRFSAADRKKMRLVKEQNPDVDVRLVFMQDNTITKTSKTKYSDWCKKYKFKYHVGNGLPKKWLKELSDGKQAVL